MGIEIPSLAQYKTIEVIGKSPSWQKNKHVCLCDRKRDPHVYVLGTYYRVWQGVFCEKTVYITYCLLLSASMKDHGWGLATSANHCGFVNKVMKESVSIEWESESLFVLEKSPIKFKCRYPSCCSVDRQLCWLFAYARPRVYVRECVSSIS